LVDIWASLLAAAADPTRAKSFRLQFIEAAKKLDPLDAAVLQGIHDTSGAITPGMRNGLAEHLHVLRDEIDVSISNLVKLGLAYSSSPDPAAAVAVPISPLGREFLCAVSD
jgi:Abortive infection alpha